MPIAIIRLLLILLPSMSVLKSLGNKAKEATKNRKVITWALVVVVIYIIRRELRKQIQEKAYDSLGSDANAQLAYRIRQACNPWGEFGGMSAIDIDGTDEQSLYMVATEIGDWQAVQNAYFNMYNESLIKRLENELGEDFVKFLNLIPKAGSVPNTTNTLNYYGYKVKGKVNINLLDIATLQPIAGGGYPANTYIGTHGGEVSINGVTYVIVVRAGVFTTFKNLAFKSQLSFYK